MIIACPACNTRYTVPKTAIGDAGRTVRCAKCKHSWLQLPLEPSLELSQEAQEPAPRDPEPAVQPSSENYDNLIAQRARQAFEAARNDEAEKSEGPSIDHWKTEDHPSASIAQSVFRRSQTAAPEEEEGDIPSPYGYRDTERSEAAQSNFESPNLEGATVDRDSADDSGESDEDFGSDSQFDYSPPFTRRRNPLKMWTIAAAIFALLALGTIAAVNLYGLPSWFPLNQPAFGMQQDGLELDFPDETNRRQTSASGTEYFEANGTVTNTGRETVSVPPILVVLRDERERIVYDWQITPPVSELAPGESVTISEAKTDVPRSARVAEIGWSRN